MLMEEKYTWIFSKLLAILLSDVVLLSAVKPYFAKASFCKRCIFLVRFQ